MPDDTSSSERAVTRIGTRGSLTILGLAIGASPPLSYACSAADGGSQPRKNGTLLIPPVDILDAASRERSEEAAAFFCPARCRPPYVKDYRRHLLQIDFFILKNS